MKKKKVLIKNELSEIILDKERLTISKFKNKWMFEIDKDITNDIAEAVSILMKRFDNDNPIWEMDIYDFKTEDITPEKSLYWLTGGYKEWEKLENYKKPWYDCYLDFQQEFGLIVIDIIKDAKKLSDIRDGFRKYLNLPTLYEFALGKDLVR
jgi:hypothetical protein